MFEGMPWEHGQDQLTVLAGRSLTGLSPLQAADALLRIDPLALLDLDQAVAETVIADLQTALNQLTALQAILIETVARRVEADVEIAKDADRLAGRFPAGWGTGDDYTPSILAPLLHVAPRTMAGRVADARILVNDLPRTLRAGLTGDLEPWRVQAIITGSLGVSPARMPDYEVAVFGDHGIGQITATALRKRAEKAAARIDPDSLAQRVQAGQRSHTVRVAPGVLPGTTDWTATAPTQRSLQAWTAVCALADEYLAGNPDLSIGQARADAFLDLLLRRVQVQTVVTINITYTTLTHLAGPAPTTATTTTTATTNTGTDLTADTTGITATARPAGSTAESLTPGNGTRTVALPEPAFPYLPADRHPPHTRTALTHTIFGDPKPDIGPNPDPVARPPALIDTGPCGWLPTTEVAAILTHPDTLIRLARLHPTTGATTHLSTDTYRPGAAPAPPWPAWSATATAPADSPAATPPPPTATSTTPSPTPKAPPPPTTSTPSADATTASNTTPAGPSTSTPTTPPSPGPHPPDAPTPPTPTTNATPPPERMQRHTLRPDPALARQRRGSVGPW